MKILIENLTKTYESKTALNDINQIFENGHIYGLYGEMGSGKSTLIKVIAGLVDYDLGSVELQCSKSKVSFLDHDKGLYNELTVRDNLRFWKKVYESNSRDIDEILNVFEHMNGIKDKVVSELSSGNQQMVALATALLNKFNILLLDEPTINLDTHTKKELFEFLKKEKENAIIIMSTHNMDEILDVCTDLIKMKDGCINSVERIS